MLLECILVINVEAVSEKIGNILHVQLCRYVHEDKMLPICVNFSMLQVGISYL